MTEEYRAKFVRKASWSYSSKIIAEIIEIFSIDTGMDSPNIHPPMKRSQEYTPNVQ